MLLIYKCTYVLRRMQNDSKVLYFKFFNYFVVKNGLGTKYSSDSLTIRISSKKIAHIKSINLSDNIIRSAYGFVSISKHIILRDISIYRY